MPQENLITITGPKLLPTVSNTEDVLKFNSK